MKVKDLLQKGFWVLLARSLSAGLMLLMTILFARWLGASDFGLFSLGLTVMTILGVIARWGADQVLLREAGIHWETDPEIVKGYTVSFIKLVLVVSLIFAISTLILNEYIAIYIFNKPEFSEVLFWIGPMIVIFSVNYIMAEAYKGIGRVVLSVYLQNIIGTFSAILLGILLYYLEKISLISITQSLAVGALVALIASTFFWNKIFKTIAKTNIAYTKILKEGLPMLLITSGGLIMAWTDIIIIGIFGTTQELGIYSIASRVVLATSLILVTINSITAPKYAKLHRVMDINGLKKLAQSTSKILVSLIAIPAILVLNFSESILSWFGGEFTEGALILTILFVGQVVNISCGSVGYILSMSGKERIVRDITLTSAMLNIVLSLILVQNFGAHGVAIATAISMTVWNIWATVEVNKCFNFWTFGNFFNYKN